MPTLATLVPLIAPLAYLGLFALSLAEPGRRPRRVLAAARLVGPLAVAAAVATAVLVALYGSATSPLAGAEGLGLSLRLDPLSAAMLLLVTFVGAVVLRFSENYLDGDDGQGRFFGGLAATLAAVSLLVTAGNLVLLVAAWIATSLALHRLLVFYPDRPRGLIAAKKKFLTARLGDVLLIGAAALMVWRFGTGDIAAIAAAARGAEGGAVTTAVAFLIVGAALLKSAQFPTHGWLTEVMETPTPVSALLHAGIINAGGFLAIRFADVLLLSAPAMHTLALVGGFTALFGAAVMLTQTSVKVSLAWSTVSQMGFMLLQCGLGAFALAVLHILAHALYKAYAFLSSGSAAEASAPRRAVAGGRPVLLVAGVAAALVLVAGSGWLFGLGEAGSATGATFGAILVMGLALLLADGFAGPRAAVVPVVAAAVGVTAAYVALHALATTTFAAVLPASPAPDAMAIAVMGLAIVSFVGVGLLQIVATTRPDHPAVAAARIHLANGLYANALFDRLIGALPAPTRTL